MAERLKVRRRERVTGAPSHALAEPERTGLGAQFGATAGRHPGRSGFKLIVHGPEALRSRRALTLLAERTLDVQYYVWENDASGRLLLAALIEAANRGVRVRLLLDAIHTGGHNAALAVIDAHPRIEVRLFNPLAGRPFRLRRLFLDLARINHRMHNKAFIADSALAIVGGRNVGDHYFTTGEGSNFRDLDLFAVGAVVRELSQSFDDFWNSCWSVPMAALVDEAADPADLPALLAELQAGPALPFATDLDPQRLAELVDALPDQLIWGEATVVADRPDKPKTERPVLLERLRALLHGSLERELLIESAYLIPGRQGTRRLCGLAARGVRVRVLTNSLASTDVALAHVGYAKYRRRLLRCGVDLHELRADARFVRLEWTWVSAHSTANLHTKALVIDRRAVVIGSLNLDPRSARINTEIAVLVECPALAAETAAFIEAGMAHDNAYELSLERNRIVWTASGENGPVRHRSEPRTGFWQRVALALLAWLPLESQL